MSANFYFILLKNAVKNFNALLAPLFAKGGVKYFKRKKAGGGLPCLENQAEMYFRY